MRTATEETQKSPPASARMGGVRADFVANLGRRITELRHHWFNLDADRASPRLRDEVRRRVHALGTRSRLLEFGAMADRLDDAERRLERSSAGGIDDADAAWFELLFVDLPALAWHEVGDQSPTAARSLAPKKANSGPLQNAGALSSTVLFVGDVRLHRSFSSSQPPAETGLVFEWECCERVDGAIELARALAPDLVLIDADIAGALELTRALGRDPLTEPVPVMVMGSFSTPEQSAPFLVAGVVRALARPVGPEAVIEAVVYSLRAKEQHAPVEGFGDLTVEQVAQRLVDEIHFGLVDSVATEARGLRVPIGEGTEVLAAIWSAVARVRDTLTIRSKGQLRFNSRGPIGAVPMAPWLDSRSADDNAKREMSRGEADSAIRLDGRRILVVDDDPAITWFLSGLLRAHGATVFEARDGVEAFELACKASPELVISDILMPKLDGFGLCKALKRDVALRDVPVILLSWKEDLLQRLRELGADADGYLRKEASSTAIVRAVFEALRPRIRVEGRLRSGGEVRGRLDGLTARSLLQLVCGACPDAKVAIRDANHLYEIQVRSGVPRSALRVAHDGTTLRGASVFAHILSLASGRFSVTPSSQVLTFDLEGDLITLLSEPIARARAGQLLLTGARLLSVQQVTLRRELLAFGPLPSNKILDALSDGASPIELIRDQGIAPSLLELILNDASCRGAVLSVVGQDGADWMPSEIEQQLERLQPKDLSIRPPLTRRNSTIPTTKPYEQIIESEEDHSEKKLSEFRFESGFPGSLDGTEVSSEEQSKPEKDSDPPRMRSSDEPPTSLAEAVIRGTLEKHDGSEVAVSSSPTPLGDWNLRPRMSARVEATRSFPQSLPPDAIVPAGEMSHPDLVGLMEPSIPAEPSIPPPASVRGFALLEAGYGEHGKATEDAEGIFETSTDCVSELRELGHDEETGEERVDSDLRDTGICPDSSDESRKSEIEEGDEPSGERRSGSMVPFLLTAVIIVGLVAAGLHFANRSNPEIVSGPVQASATTSAARVSDGGMVLPSMGTAVPASEFSDLPLPQGVRVGMGRGLLEIRTSSADAKVSVDAVVKGTGKRVSVEVEPGEHVVDVSINGQRGQRRAVTRVGRLTLVDAENLWPR